MSAKSLTSLSRSPNPVTGSSDFMLPPDLFEKSVEIGDTSRGLFQIIVIGISPCRGVIGVFGSAEVGFEFNPAPFPVEVRLKV